MRTNYLKQSSQLPSRHKLMAQVHIAAKHLDIEHGSEEYRIWLEKHAGVRSCKDLSDIQLSVLVERLRNQGYLERKLTGNAPNRPTAAQWRKMETLKRQLGFGYGMTPQFEAFVKRVAKLDNPRFFTSKTISMVIIWLEKWLEYKKQQTNIQGKTDMPQ